MASPSGEAQTVKKIAFLPFCVCRGDHWSPVSLPQQRIFRESFLQGKRARASNARPYKRFSAAWASPEGLRPQARVGAQPPKAALSA